MLEPEGCPVAGDEGIVVMRDPDSVQDMKREARVQRIDHVGSTYFVGFKYLSPITLRDTFLGAYEQKDRKPNSQQNNPGEAPPNQDFIAYP